MELLETTPIPWAQGVAGSNPAAPTIRFHDIAGRVAAHLLIRLVR
jgi:hypothetical protein